MYIFSVDLVRMAWLGIDFFCVFWVVHFEHHDVKRKMYCIYIVGGVVLCIFHKEGEENAAGTTRRF